MKTTISPYDFDLDLLFSDTDLTRTDLNTIAKFRERLRPPVIVEEPLPAPVSIDTTSIDNKIAETEARQQVDFISGVSRLVGNASRIFDQMYASRLNQDYSQQQAIDTLIKAGDDVVKKRLEVVETVASNNIDSLIESIKEQKEALTPDLKNKVEHGESILYGGGSSLDRKLLKYLTPDQIVNLPQADVKSIANNPTLLDDKKHISYLQQTIPQETVSNILELVRNKKQLELALDENELYKKEVDERLAQQSYDALFGLEQTEPLTLGQWLDNAPLMKYLVPTTTAPNLTDEQKAIRLYETQNELLDVHPDLDKQDNISTTKGKILSYVPQALLLGVGNAYLEYKDIAKKSYALTKDLIGVDQTDTYAKLINENHKSIKDWTNSVIALDNDDEDFKKFVAALNNMTPTLSGITGLVVDYPIESLTYGVTKLLTQFAFDYALLGGGNLSKVLTLSTQFKMAGIDMAVNQIQDTVISADEQVINGKELDSWTALTSALPNTAIEGLEGYYTRKILRQLPTSTSKKIAIAKLTGIAGADWLMGSGTEGFRQWYNGAEYVDLPKIISLRAVRTIAKNLSNGITLLASYRSLTKNTPKEDEPVYPFLKSDEQLVPVTRAGKFIGYGDNIKDITPEEMFTTHRYDYTDFGLYKQKEINSNQTDYPDASNINIGEGDWYIPSDDHGLFSSPDLGIIQHKPLLANVNFIKLKDDGAVYQKITSAVDSPKVINPHPLVMWAAPLDPLPVRLIDKDVTTIQTGGEYGKLYTIKPIHRTYVSRETFKEPSFKDEYDVYTEAVIKNSTYNPPVNSFIKDRTLTEFSDGYILPDPDMIDPVNMYRAFMENYKDDLIVDYKRLFNYVTESDDAIPTTATTNTDGESPLSENNLKSRSKLSKLTKAYRSVNAETHAALSHDPYYETLFRPVLNRIAPDPLHFNSEKGGKFTPTYGTMRTFKTSLENELAIIYTDFNLDDTKFKTIRDIIVDSNITPDQYDPATLSIYNWRKAVRKAYEDISGQPIADLPNYFPRVLLKTKVFENLPDFKEQLTKVYINKYKKELEEKRIELLTKLTTEDYNIFFKTIYQEELNNIPQLVEGSVNSYVYKLRQSLDADGDNTINRQDVLEHRVLGKEADQLLADYFDTDPQRVLLTMNDRLNKEASQRYVFNGKLAKEFIADLYKQEGINKDSIKIFKDYANIVMDIDNTDKVTPLVSFLKTMSMIQLLGKSVLKQGGDLGLLVNHAIKNPKASKVVAEFIPNVLKTFTSTKIARASQIDYAGKLGQLSQVYFSTFTNKYTGAHAKIYNNTAEGVGISSQKVLDGFFSANGLRSLDDARIATTVASAKMLLEEIKTNIITKNSKTALFKLNELGVRKEDLQKILAVITRADVESPEYRELISRLAKRITVMPADKFDHPIWSAKSNSIGKLLWQFQTFVIGMSDYILKPAYREIKEGLNTNENYTTVERSKLIISGAFTVLGLAVYSYVTDAIVSPALSPKTYQENQKDNFSQALTTAISSGAFGRISPIVNSVLSFRTGDSLAGTLAGALGSVQDQNLKAALLALQDLADQELKPKTKDALINTLGTLTVNFAGSLTSLYVNQVAGKVVLGTGQKLLHDQITKSEEEEFKKPRDVGGSEKLYTVWDNIIYANNLELRKLRKEYREKIRTTKFNMYQSYEISGSSAARARWDEFLLWFDKQFLNAPDSERSKNIKEKIAEYDKRMEFYQQHARGLEKPISRVPK